MTEEIKTININQEDYPESLKNIAHPPKVLYYKGTIKKAENCFAIVGARNFSPYGKQAALKLARDLTNAGLTIVSGLAPGIDTFAHQAVVEMKKRTIAVLGTGIDEQSIFPKENIKLAQQIVENDGLVISEYGPGIKGSKFTFPQRNRIIAGLALGVIVVEAKSKSGALITANYALSQNKKVFALPGSIYSPNSKGPHQMIKKGAYLAENSNDILLVLKM